MWHRVGIDQRAEGPSGRSNPRRIEMVLASECARPSDRSPFATTLSYSPRNKSISHVHSICQSSTAVLPRVAACCRVYPVSGEGTSNVFCREHGVWMLLHDISQQHSTIIIILSPLILLCKRTEIIVILM